jgi:predicted glycoside hydrolase/deacetylase ChbG (UPF0249 family)
MGATAGKYAIFNADDFGYSRGINRGIVEAHQRGVVTSATLMINGPAVDEAIALSRENPELAVGLHVNFTNEAQRLVDLEDRRATKEFLNRQFDLFCQRLGRKPTHLDSHQHVHRHPVRRRQFQELAFEHGIPLRDEFPVTFKGGFYGQWEYGVTDPSKISFEALEGILRREIDEGVYEVSCHPGYVDPALECVYHAERELELKTLCDPRLKAVLAEEGIGLLSYARLREVAPVLHLR